MRTYFDYLVKQAVDGKLGIFDLALKDCHPFIFMPISGEPKECGDFEESIDLPFPIVSIECFGQHLAIPREEDKVKTYINLILAKEISPKEYIFLVYGEKRDSDKIYPLVFMVTKEDEAYKNVNFLLYNYLKRLSSHKIGVGPKQNKVKSVLNGKKIFWRPKQLTIVSTNKYKYEAEKNFKSIDWSHRWEVRGHWRKIEGLGKDRADNYGVIGFTWVKCHSKGPENKPVIKKAYLVKEAV